MCAHSSPASEFVSRHRKKIVNNAHGTGVTDGEYVRPPGTYLGVYSGAGVATASPARPEAVVTALAPIALRNANCLIAWPLEAKSARRAVACVSIFTKNLKGFKLEDKACPSNHSCGFAVERR